MGGFHSHSGHQEHENCQGHSHGKDLAPKAIRNAILITVLFMIIEVVGGWVSNSLALISDGAHMLTDIGAMLLSLFALWVARRPTTLTMSFGYHRAEILGALVSGLIIWLIAGVLIYEAVLRIQSPPEVQAPILLVVAIFGLIANLVSMKMLHSSRSKDINVRAAYLHLLSDALGSVGAVIAGIVLWTTGWRLIDPLITIFFAILMLIGSWGLIKETVGVLMESTPSHLDPTQVQKSLESLAGVREAHDLHIWSVSSGKMALSVHLISETAETVLNAANDLLQTQFGIIHTTIQIEHPEKFQSKRCYDCVPVEMRPNK